MWPHVFTCVKPHVIIVATHMESLNATSWIVVQTETLMDALKKEIWSRRIRPQDWATMRWLLKSNYKTDRGKRWPEGPKKKKGGAGKERKSWILFSLKFLRSHGDMDMEPQGRARPSLAALTEVRGYLILQRHHSLTAAIFLLFWWSKMVAYWIDHFPL